MMLRFVRATLIAVAAVGIGGLPALAAEDGKPPRSVDWSFDGLFGSYDRDQIKRGAEIYDTACASCHKLEQVLGKERTWLLAGIGFDGDTIRALLENYEKSRPGREGQVAAGLNPPDLSLIVSARAGGANYLYSLLTGYVEAEQCVGPDGEKVTLEPGQYCNPYFPGTAIAMAPPLPGEPEAVEKRARDVTAFLAWSAEPFVEDRRRLGYKVILFLLVFTAIFYAIYRQIWAGVKKKS